MGSRQSGQRGGAGASDVRQADGDEGTAQHTDRGQSALRGEIGFAHSGHSLAGISSERRCSPSIVIDGVPVKPELSAVGRILRASAVPPPGHDGNFPALQILHRNFAVRASALEKFSGRDRNGFEVAIGARLAVNGDFELRARWICSSAPVLLRLAPHRLARWVLALEPVWRKPGAVARVLRSTRSFEAYFAGGGEHGRRVLETQAGRGSSNCLAN